LFAAERAEHAGEVAGRGDGGAQAAADRLALGGAAEDREIVSVLRDIEKRTNLIAVVPEPRRQDG
jgi:hypothetical protein